MRSLKNHLSLIIPLFAILFAAEFYLVISKILKNYEIYLSRDYSIVVVSQKSLSLEELKAYEPSISKIEELDSSLVIERLKKSGIELNYSELKNFMPKFYKIYLETFPDTDTLKKIKGTLLEIEGISRVETFTKTHEKIFHFLSFLNNISKFFLLIIFVTSVMLVFKQIEIWNLEHSERMYIMALFGAPLWMRTAILVKLSVIDTLISTILVYFVYLYLLNSDYLKNLLGTKDIIVTSEDIFSDSFWLFLLGLAISLFNVFIVSMREPKQPS